MGRLLTFSRDGVLRLRLTARGQGRETVIRDVPLAALELAHDPHALLSALSDPVVFEPGLTVLDLLENLAPWEGQIGALVLSAAGRAVGRGPARRPPLRNDRPGRDLPLTDR